MNSLGTKNSKRADKTIVFTSLIWHLEKKRRNLFQNKEAKGTFLLTIIKTWFVNVIEIIIKTYFCYNYE